ncbi:MAG: plasmid partition protein ParG [Coleofasciculaceae cyanobacterium]
MTEKSARLSIYISEDLRTKFKMACTAKQISMNQVLIDFIEGWTEENDPFKEQQKQQPPEPKGVAKTKKK